MQTAEGIFDAVLKARGFDAAARKLFLAPDYDRQRHDPFLMPDMAKAVERIKAARDKKEKVVVYGDYDIDGLSATALLLDVLPKFGLDVGSFIPNRFVDGYGLSGEAIADLAKNGAELIITVDCGSVSHKEIEYANSLGVDVIVTDHHNVGETMPSAVAVINPKRKNHDYPFNDLAGVGVAFKLAQALQQKLDGLPEGQEKWLLDLVAMGTVCDIVQLADENRANVFWGLKVMQKSRRPGLKALAAVAGLELKNVNTRHLGFVIGPHLNASGRLETAQKSLDVLTADDKKEALAAAQVLRDMNLARRAEQNEIFESAKIQAKNYDNDPVLVLSDKNWSHGIIGIVAAKILETYQKPTYILQEIGDEAKGSARSYGDFSAAEAIKAADKFITKGGGHKLAAGVTLPKENIGKFRESVNDFYRSLELKDQHKHLQPGADVTLETFSGINEELLDLLAQLEPCGHGNPAPVFHFTNIHVANRREMGADKSHLKLTLRDEQGSFFDVVAFRKAGEISAKPANTVEIWCQLELNEWNGRRSVQGKLLKITAN